MAMTVYEAGKKGGLACLRNQGTRFFSEIGKRGQQETRRRYPEMAARWGRLGGRPRKLTLRQIMEENGEQ